MSSRHDDFFIGWRNDVPMPLRRFLATVVIAFVMALGGLGLAIGFGQDDPDAGSFDPEAALLRPDEWRGGQVIRGRLQPGSPPLLAVPADAAYPDGRVLLLSGDGKRGPAVGTLAGLVEAKGGIIKRGSIEMLVLEEPLRSIDDSATPPAPVQPLGRWRVAGEVCDGKCYAGAMRPGRGVSHRACANLCLAGELPAILVAFTPVEGRGFLVLATADGSPPYRHLSGHVATPVTLEGNVDRVGNVLVLRFDPDRIGRP